MANMMGFFRACADRAQTKKVGQRNPGWEKKRLPTVTWIKYYLSFKPDENICYAFYSH